MRVPLSWLREFVDVDLDPEELAVRLTLLGMEVKGIELGHYWLVTGGGHVLPLEVKGAGVTQVEAGQGVLSVKGEPGQHVVVAPVGMEPELLSAIREMASPRISADGTLVIRPLPSGRYHVWVGGEQRITTVEGQ